MTINRKIRSARAIIGDLLVNDVFECYTLEGPRVDIPVGTYPVEITWSPRFQEMAPLLDNVAGRTDIRIHPGNTDADTEGCILVGTQHTQTTVENSRKAFQSLMAKLTPAKSIRLTIQDDSPA